VIRVGAIGYGDIAQRRHFPQLKELAGRAELVGISGRDRGRMAEVAGRFGCRCYGDASEMLADPSIDAVLVLTPPESHADFAEMAVRAGKHVMVEKPLVRSVDEALRLRAAVREGKTFFALPHVKTAEHGLVEGLIRGGAVGQVTLVENHRGHRGPTHAGWFYDRKLAGGGMLIDLGIYQLTAMAHLFGPAVRMAASCATVFATRTLDDGSVVRPDVEDSAVIALEMKSGIAVSVIANWNGSLSHHATRGRVIVTGREGMLHFGVADGAVYIYRPDGDYSGLPVGAEPAPFDGYACRRLRVPQWGAAVSLVGAFVQMIEAEESGVRGLDIQVHVMDMVAAAYAGGGTVELPARF